MSKPMQVLLEDSWEADDVKEECERLGIACRELTVEELEAVDAREFVLDSCYMCTTDIAHNKLREVLGPRFSEKVPGTYPQGKFQALLRRQVGQATLGVVVRGLRQAAAGEQAPEAKYSFPLFVKPTSNDKSFDGMALKNVDDLDYLLDNCKGNGLAVDAEALDRLEVYVAEVVNFVSEFRLFIGGGRLYGTGTIRGEDKAETIPKEFLQEVQEACGPEVFWAVDVGRMERGGEAGTVWAVVEVNPAFALDDHGLPIEPYCQYCLDACTWIRAGCSR